ncbi:hypothetical protein HDU97_009518, partial [Phlyctochytrium planicorne]
MGALLGSDDAITLSSPLDDDDFFKLLPGPSSVYMMDVDNDDDWDFDDDLVNGSKMGEIDDSLQSDDEDKECSNCIDMS